MPRLRMASGMAAVFVDAVKGPVGAACWFIVAVLRGLLKGLWIACCAVGRAAMVALPILLLMVTVAGLSYLGYQVACNWIAQAKVAAEATWRETAFNESLEAAADEAEGLEINERVRAMVGSSLAVSGESIPGSAKGRELSSLEGVPDEPMEYEELTVVSPRSLGDHTVRLMVMRTSGREYVSVEVDGELAYMCAVEKDEYGERDDLWPWVYKGIGLWEHLLEHVESVVDRDRQQREIDSRFGNLEEGR